MQSIKKLIVSLWQKTIIRFLCIGVFNTLFDFLLLNIFTAVFGLSSIPANSISVTIAVSLSYLINHKIVFRDPNPLSFVKYLKFLAITGLGVIIIQDAVIYIVNKLYTYKPGAVSHIVGLAISTRVIELNLAKALAAIFTLLWNFLFYKYVIFRHSDTNEKSDEFILA